MVDFNKIKCWVKNPYNLAFLGILLFAIVIRFYYFLLTKNQPLWWDEAEYMSTAKSFAGMINFDYSFALNRFPGFAFLVSLFYRIGINNEIVLKFLVSFLPSIVVLILAYYVLTSMYPDKRIALISMAIFSVLWEHVFYSNRFHTENLSLIFEFLTIIILFRVYLKNKDFYFIKSKYALLWIASLSILSVLFRSGNMIFIPVMMLFLIIVNFYRLNSKLKIPLGLGIISLVIIALILVGSLAKSYPVINMFYHYELPIAWSNFSVFYGFYQSLVSSVPTVLFYAFLIGIIVVIGSIFIFPEGLKKINKNVEDNSYKADLFNLILIFAVLFFFIFMLRVKNFEYRWFFIFLPGMFAFTSKGIIKFSEFIKSLFKLKYLSGFLIILILFLGIYTQFNHADMIIKAKLTSYSEVKDSGLWMKSNSNKGDIVISSSQMQHAYYGEMKVYNLNWFSTEENLTRFIKENHPKYLVLSIFEPHPSWAYSWPENKSDIVKPVQAYYDPQTKQPVLIIYQFI